MMSAYQIFPVDTGTINQLSTNSGTITMPSWSYALFYTWIRTEDGLLSVPEPQFFWSIGTLTTFFIQIVATGNSANIGVIGNPPNNPNPQQWGASADTPDFSIGTWYNLAISIDTLTPAVQIYLNGSPLTVTMFETEGGTMAAADYLVQLFEQGGVYGACLGDTYFSTLSSFFDLSVAENLAKIISNGLPVDAGSNGQNITGSVPEIFLSLPNGSPPSDFGNNLGNGGSDFVEDGGVLETCAAGPYPATVYPTASVGEVWFGPTSEFVDITAESNRLKFVGQGGTTAYLGDDGALPFGSAPPVYLAVLPGQTAADFANNNGTGGAFTISTGSLALLGSEPPSGQYVETISGQSLNTPPGADPQIMLDMSDDGARTWKPRQLWRSMGLLGDYLTRLRWLSLGYFRQRVLRLTVTDPVRRNFVGFYSDTEDHLD